jgi:1,4-dihydroxy-2-naphthoate octaprenyltransferase
MVLSGVLATIFVFIFSYSIYFLGFAIFGSLLGWFYTAPPIKLAYNGLGEIANMINMGLLMPGIGYWVMKGNLDFLYFAFAGAFFLYGLEFMIIVETPDMEGDIKENKLTFVARYGRKLSYILLLASLIGASLYYLSVGFLGLFDTQLNFFVLFLLSLFPLTIALAGWLKRPLEKEIASKIAERNMYTLITFVIFINVYFIVTTVLG